MRPSIAHHGILWEQTHGGGKHGRNDQKGKSIWFPGSFFAVTAHQKTSVTPGPLPKRPKSKRGYRLILCPLAWFLQVLLGCSCPSAWHFMAQNFGITCQPECVTLCSDPGRVRKTKYDLIASWFTHLHPNTCMLISIQLSCLQISFTSLTKLCILALLSLQNVQITLFWVVLNKTSKGPDSWGDLLKATS